MHAFATVYLVVLIDERCAWYCIKEKAFALLLSKEKAGHDRIPMTLILHSWQNSVLSWKREQSRQVIQRSRTEEETFHQLSKEYRKQKNLQDAIRNGACF